MEIVPYVKEIQNLLRLHDRAVHQIILLGIVVILLYIIILHTPPQGFL